MTLGLDSAFLTAARFIPSFLLEKILLRFQQLPGQSLAPFRTTSDAREVLG